MADLKVDSPALTNCHRPRDTTFTAKSGWYLRAELNVIKVRFLVDTGASNTMIDTKVFDRICRRNRVDLEPSEHSFCLADGTPMKLAGKFSGNLRVGHDCYEQQVIVTNLGRLQGLLGLDFFDNQQPKLDFSTGLLELRGRTVQLCRERLDGSCRVSVNETVCIPPDSRVIIYFSAQRGKKTPNYEVGTVEGLTSTTTNYGLVVARALVKGNDKKIPLTLMNLQSKPITLRKKTSIALLQPVACVTEFGNPELPQQSGAVNRNVLPDHLQRLMGTVGDNLTSAQVDRVAGILHDYQDIFLSPDSVLGCTDVDTHDIDTRDSKPIKQPLRRLPLAQVEEANEEVDKMLKNNVIEPSSSPWSSPIVLVTKKDGTTRFCVDYRKLNNVTVRDAYPLPRIDETFDTLAGSQWYCTLDCASGYWQVKMSEKDKQKTAFSTRKGIFQFRVMPFGLTNAPATFERLMELVLRGLQWEQCLIFLDDVIVFGKDFDETLSNLHTVFDRLRTANLKLKAKKCELFQQEIKFLGHVVTPKGVKCDPEKTKAVEDWPVPTNVTQIRSFLGLASYYRRFIPNFATIASPLTRLTKKHARFVWSEECETAFKQLKSLLLSADVVSYPQGKGNFILDTDASDTGIGAVLHQIQGPNNEEKVIAFASKTLNKSQQHYCTTKKELLAVVEFVKHFRHYLYGQRFVIRTDHASLVWLRNFSNPDALTSRWLSVIETYNYEIQHRKGSKHNNADALSRYPVTRKCKRIDCPDCVIQTKPVVRAGVDEISAHTEASVPRRTHVCGPVLDVADDSETHAEKSWLNTWSMEQLHDWQQADPCVSRIVQWKEKAVDRPRWAEVAPYEANTKAYWCQWNMLRVHDGLLYRVWYPYGSKESVLQLVASRELRQMILEELHNKCTAGHLGVSRTIKSVRLRFYWPGYKNEILSWCKKCDACAQRNRT